MQTWSFPALEDHEIQKAFGARKLHDSRHQRWRGPANQPALLRPVTAQHSQVPDPGLIWPAPPRRRVPHVFVTPAKHLVNKPFVRQASCKSLGGLARGLMPGFVARKRGVLPPGLRAPANIENNKPWFRFVEEAHRDRAEGGSDDRRRLRCIAVSPECHHWNHVCHTSETLSELTLIRRAARHYYYRYLSSVRWHFLGCAR